MLGLNRKGEDSTTWTIITAILIILAFAGLFVWIGGSFKTFAGGSTDTEICRLSVLQKAKYKIGETPILDTDLRCPTKNLNILYGKDEKISGEENIVVKNQNDVKRAIADEMFDCWYKFGNGEIDFVKGKFDPGDDKTCFVCTDIRFGKNLVASTAIGNRIEHFEDYLSQTGIPGRDITYWEYFGGKIEAENNQPNINIKLDEPQIVVFAVVKEGTWERWLTESGVSLGVVGSGLLFFSGPPGWIFAAGVASIFVTKQAVELTDQKTRMFMTVVPLKDTGGKCKIL